MAFALDPQTWLAILLVRMDGPAQLRFVLQPLVAIALGVRDGRTHERGGLRSIAVPFCVAVLIDALVSLLVLGAIYPGSTLFVGVILVALPYVLTRELVRRVQALLTRAPKTFGADPGAPLDTD